MKMGAENITDQKNFMQIVSIMNPLEFSLAVMEYIREVLSFSDMPPGISFCLCL